MSAYAYGAVQNPALLAPDDTWTRACPICGLGLQGGRDGLNAHLRVVHPEHPPGPQTGPESAPTSPAPQPSTDPPNGRQTPARRRRKPPPQQEALF